MLSTFKPLGFGLVFTLLLLLLQIGPLSGMIILSVVVAAREIYNLAYLQKSRVNWLNVGLTGLGGLIIYLLSTFI